MVQRWIDTGWGWARQQPHELGVQVPALGLEHPHHVGQVDGLPPGTGAGLDEGDVDEQQAAVADQQVGRLDVPVGQPGVPQLADDAKAVVDRLVR